ncbi:vgr related protein [Thermaurantiacus sp.]
MDARALTAGERALVRSVFGGAIDPDPVRIHRAKWWMWQPWWVTMAPDGDLWFHPNGVDWSADFAAEALAAQGFFLHEMVHVWQHQQGLDLRLWRWPFARYRYLPLVPEKPFSAYGIEQQAEIVREAFLVASGWRLPGRPALAAYARLLPFDGPLLQAAPGNGSARATA